MRRSKTLAQQAKYYEVENETDMMDLMISSWVNGNFSCFKDYYLMLDKPSRKQFINYLWCNTESRQFYKMIDFLFFGK